MKRNLVVTTVPEHGMKTDEFSMAQTTASRVFGRDKDAAVIFEGNDACVRSDGTIVYPALADGHQMTKEEVMVARGFADHETSHKRYTSTEVMNPFVDMCKKTENPFMQSIAFAVDDMRVDKLAIRDYSGAKANLEATTEAVLAEFLEFAKENPEEANDLDVVAPLMITTEGRRRMGYNSESLQPALDILTPENREKINKFTDIAMTAENPNPDEGTQEVVNLAKAIVKMKDEVEQEEEPDGEGGGEGESEGEGEGGEGESEGAPDPETSEATDPGGAAKPPLDSSELQAKAMVKNFEKYLEANGEHYRPYSTQYDRYSRVDGNDPICTYLQRHAKIATYEQVVHQMHGKISTMSRKLERALLSQQRRDWQTNTEFGGLDPKRLVQASMGKPNVFRLRDDRKEIDTAVSMMIDLSGSMHSRVVLAQQVAIALSLVMEKVGVAFEVLGWNNYFMHRSGYGATSPGNAGEWIPSEWMREAEETYSNKSPKFSRFEPLQVYEFKSFDKKLVQERLGMSVIKHCAGGHNSDNEAVKISASHLRVRPETRKILFVLSDGLPECSCSLGRNHQFQHLRNNIEELGRHGIECVGIGIQSHAVERFYPQHVVVEDLEDLPKAAFDQLAKLLVGDRFKVDNSELLMGATR